MSDLEKREIKYRDVSGIMLGERNAEAVLRSQLRDGTIGDNEILTIDIDLRYKDDETVLRVTRNIKYAIESSQKHFDLDLVNIKIFNSQIRGQVVNAVSAFRSQYNITMDVPDDF